MNTRHKLLKSSLLALCLVSGAALAHGGGWHGGGWHGGGWHGGGWHGGGWHGGGWHGGYWGGGYWGPGFVPIVAPYGCQRVRICDNYTGRCWIERRCY